MENSDLNGTEKLVNLIDELELDTINNESQLSSLHPADFDIDPVLADIFFTN